ncbi:unnamed protein product [Trichogramma brassicae]|uniref:Reverse transcriptase domain-containing protein n=1 Tax=Trichogramma brassicae TaxID=86971 RepID=A0A6H5HSV9_9HYME|nr:unnamed protein product [Trichogramma brassicae]
MVPHQVLLTKLRRFNFGDSTIKWFASYLGQRSQAVTDSNGSESAWLPTTSGVPQGSVLGTLLFSLFINDLPDVLVDPKCMLFADDLQVYSSFFPTDFARSLSAFNRNVNAVSAWATANGLSLNKAKTQLKVKIGNMEENAMHYADMCEIRFSGLPDLPDVRDIDRVATVLKVLECDERILSVRRWMPSRASNAPSTSTNATLVARFSPPVVRDAIMSCTHKLATMTGGSIFGTEDQGKIFATPMLTPPLHKLWCSALSRSRKLNYARPLIRGYSLFMRAAPASPLVQINNIDDLANLKPVEPRKTVARTHSHQE